MSLKFSVNIPVQRRAPPMSLFVLTIEQANRSVSLLGFDDQAASVTCQAAWLWNTWEHLHVGNQKSCELVRN